MTDALLAAIKGRVRTALQGKLAQDKFDAAYDCEEKNKLIIQDFCNDPDVKILLISQPAPDRIIPSTEVVKDLKGKALYFLKSEAIVDTITPEDFESGNITVSEILGGGAETLQNFSLLAHEVLFPLLSNPANRAGWSGPTSKEVMLNISYFLSNLTIIVGDSKGQTVLPLPAPQAFDEDNLPERERIHLLESAVVQWTSKIQSVLSTDPEDAITKRLNPDPQQEVNFWVAKAKDLDALTKQLKDERMTSVINTLADMQSPFAPTFEKLTQDVTTARNEANENVRFLKTLQFYINQLAADLDFPALALTFPPMCHSLLLVWQNSKTYSVKKRLETFLQEVANAVINQAQSYISGEAIFRFIEDDNTNEAITNLKNAIGVCDAFKNAFLHYQVRAAKCLPTGAWDIKMGTVFKRLDAFVLRCRDLLDFTKIVAEFNKLEKLVLGGSQGEEFSTSILVAHKDFSVAVGVLQKVPYDLMNIDKDAFDQDFYTFRCQVKGIERRLSSVLIQAFDDAPTMEAKFKLLESFEGLVERPIIRDELHLKKIPLIKGYMEDLHTIQDLFHQSKDKPLIDKNLPPVAGALAWCRTLRTRAEEPITKLREITQDVQGKEIDEAEKVFAAVIAKLKEYEHTKIVKWNQDVQATSDAKLMQALLQRDNETRLLTVNFDSVLVCLLREVKYLLLLELDVDASALEIYQKAEQYRVQIGNLDLVVHMYNDMVKTLHMVERPLVEKDIAHIDDVLEKGIAELNWKSAQVDDFAKEAITTVKQVYDTVQIMKNNYEETKKMMAEYSKVPLAERKNKPLPPSDYEDILKKLWAQRHEKIQEHQVKITQLLTQTNQALKVNKGSPIWRAYVEYVQDHVRDALATTIINSIQFVINQVDSKNNSLKANYQPLLEIKLGLYANDVLFNADDGSTSTEEKSTRKSRRDVWQILNDWVEQFFQIGDIMTRMDGSHYVGDLKKNEGIVRSINSLKKHLDYNQKECENYRQEFLKYEFLWKNDRNTEFRRFLNQALKTQPGEGKEGEEGEVAEAKPEGGEEDEEKPKDPVADILPLDKFEEKIVFYKNLLNEINEKPSPKEIGWLKVNAKPIKASLDLWIGRWIHTFTSYLYNDVTRKLNQLEMLTKDVNDGVAVEVKPGDSDALKKVLGYIHQIRTQEKTTEKMFQPMRDTVSMLKKYGKNLDDYETKLLADAPMKWHTIVNLVYEVKEKVNNLQNEEVDVIKRKVDEFDLRLLAFRKEFRKDAPFEFELGVNRAYQQINYFHHKINEYEVEASKLIDLEQVFELNVSKHYEIKRNRVENKLLKQIWDMISVVKTQFGDWKKTLWDDIDTDSLLSQCKQLLKQVNAMPKENKTWKVFLGLQGEVKNFLTVLPLVNLLHSPCMEERHWRELKQSTGKQFEKTPDFCLADLLDLELHNFVEQVEYIVELATKEDKIGKNLAKIEQAWAGLTLQFGSHAKAGSTPVSIIVSPDEILVALEEHMAALQGMQGQGKYVEYFLTTVNHWQANLGNTETVIMDWLEVQGKWQSLETIFLGSQDIRQQLPEDSKRFDGIDHNFRQLMVDCQSTPMALEACRVKGRGDMLTTMKSGLEKCEKSLNMYLETKRKAFPRFYFLANAALLDILSNGYDPQCVQKHLGDCFDAIKSLEYIKKEDGKFSNKAVGMYDKDGAEYVEWPEPFVAEGPVEEWLNRLVKHQQDSLRELMARAKHTADNWEVEKVRQEWLFDYPAMIALTASQIIWTEETGGAFDSLTDGNEQAMKEFLKTCITRLETLIMLVLGELSKQDRVKIITLITVDVHNRDVIARLIEDKILEASSFGWQSQMRFEWKQPNPDKDCVVRVADAFFGFSYEYVGNTGRLVITPLTDRCYITLTQALRLIMGGAPAGPAGTGKTETTKDLGRALGLPVYVFNCSEQMNVSSMAAIYKGLASTGAWGCFDEFNRVLIEVLSVVATQVSLVLNAIKAKVTEFNFMGEICKMIPTVGMFITMNPGYAGRTELPENLKALFRSCAMVVPDIELICENMLMSEGFLGARRLAKKFATLYGLSKELLSKQMHYDWGLRATKAVLRVAGGLKRAEPDVDEDRILMRALRDFNLPKLVDDDKSIFVRLIDDLFPGLGGTQRKFDAELEQLIRKSALKLKLQPEDTFVMKCVETAELLVIRHCVFIIGSPRCGKSEIWKTLAGALTMKGHKTVFETLNPKAIRNDELYGYLTKTDWQDGILSTIMRNMAREIAPYNATQLYKWIVLDGDIDPEWIESLNTVMDDNKMLTLVSNERIPLSNAMRLVFEISNLDNATPATVSRAGIIFVNAKDVGSKPFLDSWIEQRSNDKEKSALLALFNKYCTPENLYEVRTAFQRVVPINEVAMIQTLCYLLEGVLETMSAHFKAKGPDLVQLDEAGQKEHFEAHFVFACIWALGGASLVDKQNNFQKEFSEWWKRVFPVVKFPKEGSVFDYIPDPDTGKMLPWTDRAPAFVAPDNVRFVSQIFVATPDTTRIEYVVNLLMQLRRPTLLVGGPGTGKTALVRRYLNNLNQEKYAFSVISFNYYTDAKSLQRLLEGPLEKRSGRIFGPPNMKKLIYFLDDLNMPCVDKYNTQSPSALTRQHMDYQSWFDMTKLEKKEIKDVQYLACMNPTAGSFIVCDRLQGNFCTFSASLPKKESLMYVYSQMLNAHFKSFPKNMSCLVESIVLATIDLHDKVSSKFLPSSRKFHYIFNLRDLSAVFQGVCNADPAAKYTPYLIAKLWQHECTRVFCDRLITQEDMDEFDKLLDAASMKKEHFKEVLEAGIKTVNQEEENLGGKLSLLYTSFHGSVTSYSKVPNFSTLKETLAQKLEGYNESNAVMNLELFGAAMEHVCRVARILEAPRGNALLVGVGGSGKQSLAKLASSICGYDIFQIAVTQSYGMGDMKNDIMELYTKAGVKQSQISFILTDTQIVNDQWLVFINDFLSTGYIPDLYSNEEMDGVINGIRNLAKAAGIPDEKGALHDFFIETVRKNLHLVLCFSPVGNTFRLRCAKFPALINCSVIDMFHPWPRDALELVSYRFLDDVDMASDDLRLKVSQHMAETHLTVNKKSQEFLAAERRFNYTTPKSFLEFIAFYKTLLQNKRNDLQKQSGRLEKGIVVIVSTERDVAELKENLVETMKKVGEKQRGAAVLIEKCGVERAKVEEQQAIAAIEAGKAKTVSEIAIKIKTECEKDLEAALPMMEAAGKAVDCLTKASLTTLKSFANPPGHCVDVTNACLILLGIKGKQDWGAAKNMMKDVGKFLESLKNFDSKNIEEPVLKKLAPILANDYMTVEAMTSSSEAAANLCGWVVNIVAFNTVYKQVAPKIAARTTAETDYATAAAQLKVVEDRVAAMQAKLGKVTAELKGAIDEKTAVEEEAQACQDRLALAKRLVDGLASESSRWGKAVEGFKIREVTLVGDVLLAASFVSYIGAFNQKFRTELWKESWYVDLEEKKIPITTGIDPLYVLANDSAFAKWKNEGLAADRSSLENGAIITQCSRWPLMIDPQLQGIKWIRNRVKDLKVVQLSGKKWMRTICAAVSNGDTCMIEGVGQEIDGTLNPILSRSTVTRGGQQFIQIGAEEVSYSKDFKLLIQTKLSNPHYIPEVSAQTTLINFIVTEEGLEEQLLAMVVNKEKPELEEKRTALVRAINDYMVSLTDLENELLERLSNAPEDILSDVALIDGLEHTKKASVEIEQKVQQAQVQEISINAARNEFRDVAAESSWLYFLLISIYVIDHMYQYSLDAFTTFFLKAMDRAKPSDDVKQRVHFLREEIRIVVFTWVNRGLFEKHKLIFSCQLCFKLMMKGALREKYNAKLFNFLIRSPKILGVEKTIDWLPPNVWAGIQALIKLEPFSRFASDMEASPNRFKEWYSKGRPESSPLPLEWRKLDDTAPFQKLCILRSMRQDRMTTAMLHYVERALPDGKRFTECDGGKSFLDVLLMSLEDSTTVAPVFFILSAGADPVLTLEVIARQKGMYGERMHRVALGQGQDVIAMEHLAAGHKDGHWVVLENIHLMPRWCAVLEKQLDDNAVEGSHPDFRLFLTAEPATGIPIGLLERSIKLTNEPPQGLKANLKRAFATFDKDEFEESDPKVKCILFALCHFHSIIIERIKFGPIGWNRNYPFSTGDLLNSGQVLQNYLENASEKVPWKDLRYIFGEILYGGHITDDLDRLMCATYQNFYIKEEILDEMDLFPFGESYPDEKFKSPPVLPYDQYFEHIDTDLVAETPVAFGLHPNAEIAVKTTLGDTLFRYIMELQPRSTGGGEGENPLDRVRQLLESILETIKSYNFSLEDIASAVAEDRGPYQNVFLQECERMNLLCNAMRKSLKELELGLNGELQMSGRMEALQDALFMERVPPAWEKLAYPSLRGLGSWMSNLSARAVQLQGWVEDPLQIPQVTQLSFLFNPQSFLTAIMQITAQRNKLELDKLVILTDVTRKTVEAIDSRARDGAYVTGLSIEGARWSSQAGTLEESEPREMFCEMPVINCRAIMLDKMDKNGVYRCPVYKTAQRGPTFVFMANLRSKAPPEKWVLAGVCLLLENPE